MNTTPGSPDELREYPFRGLLINGFAMLFFVIILLPGIIIASLVIFLETIPALALSIAGVSFVLWVLGCKGYFVQEPNDARVMIFFGRYVGTCHKVGFYWANPFISRKKLSLRVSNMDIEPIKVNDRMGNPVMIGMVLVWKIRDTYRTVFDIDCRSLSATGTGTDLSQRALESFVRIQSDAALREVASHYAYDDPHDSDDPTASSLTLRGGGQEINDLLERKINDRLRIAGMEVVEARLNYLAYAPEIAAVMLRRQQASAIIAAREKIVEGAVSMVQMALQKIDDDHIATLDPTRRAAMVSNLLLVLCSDEPATPVINATD